MQITSFKNKTEDIISDKSSIYRTPETTKNIFTHKFENLGENT